MADTIYDADKEPATKHDTTEGGVIGAVGGAIVGVLAGGPVGAIIGAVVGGAASAAAVHEVDKHDHDYSPASAYANSADANVNDSVSVDSASGTVVTTPAAYDTTYATTNTAAGTSYATTAVPAEDEVYETTMATPAHTTAYETTTSYPATTPVSTSTAYTENTAVASGDQIVVPIVEEEMQVGKRVEETGGARVHTEVIEHPVSESINLREEHVTVDRHSVDRPATGADFGTGTRDFSVTESREVPVVAKEARVVEEVVIGKTATDRTETINDTVRRTEVVVDDVDATKKTY